MQYLIWAIVIIVSYFSFVFIVLRLIVPFMGFSKPALPKVMPEEYGKLIIQWEGKSSNPMEYLRLAFAFASTNWHGGRMRTVLHPFKAFRTDLQKLWGEPGYAHCTTQNYILYSLLAFSKYFKPDDIRFRHVFLNMFIHQYLQVRVNNEWIDADPTAVVIGNLPLGKHASIFL